jgi:hypothetical protein
MRLKSMHGVFVGIVAGSVGIALVLTSTARSADQSQGGATGEVPRGYVLVNQEELRKLVHDEVSRQLQAIVKQARGEQQAGQAVARVRAAASVAQSLRAQIALYKLQHDDRVPSVVQVGDGFKFLTLKTDVNGKPSNDDGAFGPYLTQPVVNPATGKSKVVAVGKADQEAGWTYDPPTGRVKAVFPAQLDPKLKAELDSRDAEYAAAN